MPRTKCTARVSVGGKAPRKQLCPKSVMRPQSVRENEESDGSEDESNDKVNELQGALADLSLGQDSIQSGAKNNMVEPDSQSLSATASALDSGIHTSQPVIPAAEMIQKYGDQSQPMSQRWASGEL
ncbi:hypothetical protein FB107DRAFT_225125 [Schizophyllum commune]